MDYELELPDVSKLSIKRPDGITVIEEEVIYLESMLVECQRPQNGDETQSRESWLPIFRQMLNAKYEPEVPLTDTESWAIAVKVVAVSEDLKKSMNQLLDSVASTEPPSKSMENSPSTFDTTFSN